MGCSLYRWAKQRIWKVGHNIVLGALKQFYNEKSENLSVEKVDDTVSEPNYPQEYHGIYARISRNFRKISEDSEKKLLDILAEYYGKSSSEQLSEDERTMILEHHMHTHLNDLRIEVVPWIESLTSLNGASVLEIGCGTGISTLAFAEQGADVVAIDIASKDIAMAQKRCKLYGLENINFLELGVADLVQIPGGGGFDLIIYSRTFEHLTYTERIQSIKETYDMLKDGGYIVIYDAPNRLWHYDSHTSLASFFHWLPDELAVDYAKYTTRDGFNEVFNEDKLSEGTGAFRFEGDKRNTLEKLARFGRGVSYHELEIALNRFEKLDISDFKRKFLGYSMSEFSKVLKSVGPGYVDEWFYDEILSFAIMKK